MRDDKTTKSQQQRFCTSHNEIDELCKLRCYVINLKVQLC